MMNPIDPRQLTGKWLEMTLKNLAERAIDEEDGAKEALFTAIESTVLGLDSNYIEEIFRDWIDCYQKVVFSHQNNQSNSLQLQDQEDS